MKNEKKETSFNSKIIQINDMTDIIFNMNKGNHSPFSISILDFTKSLASNDFMLISYLCSPTNGLDTCINYTDGYDMKSFVECFQSFIENK